MVTRVAVLGGGVSGLTAASNLLRRKAVASGSSLEVVLYEGSSRVGGWVRSELTSEGAVLEVGTRSLRSVGIPGRASLELASSLGLEDEVIPITRKHPAAGRRLIYTKEHGLLDAPMGLSWVFKTKPPFTKPLLGAIVRELFTPRGTSKDETVYDFFSRRMNNEIADYLVDPLCRGVYASSPRSLSLKSTFPDFHQSELKSGSLIRGMLTNKSPPPSSDASTLVKRSVADKWSIFSFKDGLQTLTDALHRDIAERGGQVQLNQPCTRLSFGDGKAKVEVGDDSEVFDHVVSCLPAHALAALLSSESHPTLKSALSSINSVTVGVVCLEYEGQVLPKDIWQAFGYLVPSNQSSRILGVVFDSSTFPEHNRKDIASTRLTVMLGGEWFTELFGSPETVSEENVKTVALEELQYHLGITQHPSHCITAIHKNCIPHYTVGHSETVESLMDYVSQHKLPLTLIGASFNGVSVNNCVYHALQATNNLLLETASVGS